MNTGLPLQTTMALARPCYTRRSLPGYPLWLALLLACFFSFDAYSATRTSVVKRSGTNWFEKVYSLAFSPDGKVLAVGSSAPALAPPRSPGNTPLPEGTIELWDLGSGKLRSTLRQSARTENGDQANRVGALAFSPDGQCLIGSDLTGYTLWDVASGKAKFKWRNGLVVEPLSAGWSPDAHWIALPSIVQPGAGPFEVGPNGVALVEAATGKARMFFPVEVGYARTSRISPDGKLLATAGHDCTVRVFDLASMTNVFTDFVQTTMFAAAFSPDGRYLLAGSSWGDVLLIYEVHSEGGRFVIRKKGQSTRGAGEVHSLEFTLDGKRALCNSAEEVELWDASTWSTLRKFGEGIACLSPNEMRIALARESTPNRVEVWQLGEFERSTLSAGR